MGLTKRKDGYYAEFAVAENDGILTLAIGGKLKRWKIGPVTLRLAKCQEAIIKAGLLRGKKIEKAEKGFAFRSWANTYLGLEEVRTLRSYKDRKWIVPLLVEHFGDRVLPDITPVLIESYREKRLNSGVSVATVNYEHAILKHLLGIAERRELIPSNPAKKVRLTDPHNERDRVLTEDEWERLYAAAKLHIKPIILIAYQLGLRKGEITGLTWDQVDFKNGFIRLRGEDTKNGESRNVPLTPEVRSALADLSRVRRLDTNRIFFGKHGPLGVVHHAFRQAVKQAGIMNLRFHDLRHCAATNLRRAGVDTITAMKIIGHKSERVHRRYNSVGEADLTQAAVKLNTYLSNTVITPANPTHKKATHNPEVVALAT